MSVGNNISRMRTARGLSQAELADLVGITQSMVAQIERGSKVPTVVLAVDIARALNGTINDIVNEAS